MPTPPERVAGYLVLSALVAMRFPVRAAAWMVRVPVSTKFQPQNHGAVSRDACDQIERKAMPKICRVFNEFCPGVAYLIIDVERAGGPRMARRRRRFRTSAAVVSAQYALSSSSQKAK